MTSAADTIATAEAGHILRRERRFARINKAAQVARCSGVRLADAAAAASRRATARANSSAIEARAVHSAHRDRHLHRRLGVLAPQVETSLGAIPGPGQVWEQAAEPVGRPSPPSASQGSGVLRAADDAQRRTYRRRQSRQRSSGATTPASRPIFDQILTSLKTVGLGFIIATLIAVPLGIACGLSTTLNGAINPLIQIFKPVSPLAWLPIVTMVVSALYVEP